MNENVILKFTKDNPEYIIRTSYDEDLDAILFKMIKGDASVSRIIYYTELVQIIDDDFYIKQALEDMKKSIRKIELGGEKWDNTKQIQRL